MSKLLLAVVRDEYGLTVEVRATTSDQILALLSQASAVVSAIEDLDTPPASAKVGEPVGANGAILAALGSLIQKAAAALPTLLPEILQIISLFGSSAASTSTSTSSGCSGCCGEKVGAPGIAGSGAILTALGNLLQTAVTELPAILPEILQLISLLGGKVQAVPTPSA